MTGNPKKKGLPAMLTDVPCALLYTIGPLDVLALHEASVKGATQAPRLLTWQGRSVLVTVNAQGETVIERLLSTRPADYLDPRLQPGASWPPA